MKNQKYSVKLNDEQRKELIKFTKSTSRKNTPQCKTHAKILLCLDENGKSSTTPEQTAKKCKIHQENVYKIRKQFVTEGIERVLNRKKREIPPVPPKVTGEVEAHIIAVACSAVPDGKKAWTLQMRADKIVLDNVRDSLGREAVRRTLCNALHNTVKWHFTSDDAKVKLIRIYPLFQRGWYSSGMRKKSALTRAEPKVLLLLQKLISRRIFINP